MYYKEKQWKSDIEMLNKRTQKRNKIYHGRQPLKSISNECSTTKKSIEKVQCVPVTKDSKKVTRGARRKCCFVGCKTNDKNKI